MNQYTVDARKLNDYLIGVVRADFSVIHADISTDTLLTITVEAPIYGAAAGPLLNIFGLTADDRVSRIQMRADHSIVMLEVNGEQAVRTYEHV